MREFATRLAWDASAEMLRHQGGRWTKSDGTPVTEVDRAIGAMVRDRVGARYPNHGVLIEDSDTVDAVSRLKVGLAPAAFVR